MKELRVQLRQRLKDEGRWREFVEYRKQLAEQLGYSSVGKATKEAAQAFQPLNPPGEPPPTTEKQKRKDEQTLKELNAEANSKAEPKRPQPYFSSVGGDSLRSPGGGDDLLDPEMFEGKEQPAFRAVVNWVLDNLDVDVDYATAPSSGAVSILRWARASMENSTEFFRTFASKLLPTRSQLEREESKNDDGRDVTRTIDRLLQNPDAVREHGAPGPSEEPGVPQESD